MQTFRVIIARGAQPDEMMTFSDVDAYGAAEQAIYWCQRYGWRKYGIRRVERRGWVTSLDFSPPRQDVRRPQEER